MDRKTFLTSGMVGLSGLATIPVFGASPLQEGTKISTIERIKEFVVAGHSDLGKIKSMLAEEPNLIYSRYDWGGGDFEEAIEGAGHIGNKEIAYYLIEQGARVNLFTLTMLGKEKIVIPTLEEFPSLLHAKGPHGFTLLHHAQVGGKDSRKILDFLTKKGLKETKLEIK